MEQPLDNVVYLENAVDDGSGPVMNCTIFNDLLEFQMKNNPALAGKTKRDIAEACYMSESTLKNMCSGKNDNPRIGTLKRILRYIGGGSVDRMIGFAPPRDFEKEEAQYDASLVEAIQIRLDEKRARIEELEDQLDASEKDRDRLRKLVLEKGEALSEARTRAAAAEQIINERNGSIARRDQRYDETVSELKIERGRNRRLVAAIVILSIAIVSICTIYVWDAANLNRGLTAWFHGL